MAYTPEQEEFFAYRDAEAEKLGDATLPANPNLPIRNYLSFLERKYAVYDWEESEVRTRAEALFNAEEMADINRVVESIDWENRVSRYNKPPIEHDMEVFFPGWAEQQREWKANQETLRSARGFPEDAFLPDMPSPFGLERSEQLTRRGIDPRKGVQIDNLADRNLFKLKLALSPRNSILRDVEHAGKEYLGEGEYVYLDPTFPSLGVGFIPEGEDDIQLINTGGFNEEDVYNFLLQEFPAAAGDIALTIYGASKFSSPTGITGTIFAQAAKTLTMSGLAAVGAAGGDFLRLTAGKVIGAHDRDLMEILKESGMIGAWAFAGTGTIDLAQRAIPKVWRLMTGTDVPPAFFERISAARAAAASPESATVPRLLYGDPVSVQRIRDQIQELTDRYGVLFNQEGKPPGWNPTIGARAATPEATDLELTFLKNADDPKLMELYREIKEGNQIVIQEFLDVLREKVGPAISGIDSVTSAELSKGLQSLAQKDLDDLINQMDGILDKVRTQALQGQGADAAVAGSIIRDVADDEASGTLFPRVQRKIREIRDAYLEPVNANWNKALGNPRYANTATGSGQTREPAEAWIKAREGEAKALLASAETDEAVSLLYQQRLGGSNETLRRLQGLAREGNIDPKTGKPGITGGRFESPEFSLAELNSMRVSLNTFAGETTNQTARKHALDLMSGIEEQMHTLVKQSASESSGIPLTPARKTDLNKWIEDNQWGTDLIDAWTAQKEAYQLGNTAAIKSLLQQERPEAVAAYLFDTSVKGSAVNTPVEQLMILLRQEGANEIIPLQEGLAAYIQRVIFDAPGLTTRRKAINFGKFVKEHEGVLKSVFGEEEYARRFNRGPRKFQENVIEELQRREVVIKRLKDQFNLAGAEGNEVTNIVESILTAGKTAQQSGSILEDIGYLTNLVKDYPELQAQISQVTKRFIIQDIVTSRRGGGSTLNIQRLDDLLNKGFGPIQITGDKLTFENFITPLLGDEIGPEFIRNLEVLNSLAQREAGAESLDILGSPFSRGEFGPGSPIEGARIIMKMLIKPLTQLGRRATALTTRAADRARTFIGHMLLDEELFNKTMRYAQGRVSRQNFIRYLSAHHFVAAQDLGNELKYYDTEEKVQKTPPSRTTFEDFIGLGAEMTGRSLDYPNRLLDLWYGEPD